MADRLRSALAGFEARLERAGVPVVANLRPPATEQVLRRLESETGYAARGEPLLWWQWHDGVQDPEPSAPRTAARLPYLQWGGSGFRALTIESALRSWAQRVRLARETAEDAEADGWEFLHSDSWFPIGESESGAELLIDLNVDSLGASAVRVWEWSDAEGRASVRARSMARMVEHWNDALDRGLWQYASGRWESNFAAMTIEQRLTFFL